MRVSKRVRKIATAAWEFLRLWMEAMNALWGALGRRRARAARPWQMRIRPFSMQKAKLSQAEVNHLLQQHRDLQDVDKIAQVAGKFHLPESDFFADPQQVERLIRRLVEANPPWLHISEVLPGDGEGAEAQAQETLWREQETREIQDVTLFVPDESWRDLPLSSMTMRQARHLEEVWQGRLLDQILPPEVLVDRFSRGEILIPIRNRVRQRLEFKPEFRRMEVTVRKPVAVPIDMVGGSGSGGQLLYFLLDYSASMQGKPATLAMAVIAATLRAHIGQVHTRYLFRRYAEDVWPRIVEVPIQAQTLAEKDRLLDLILSTNFNGEATHVNHALDIAVADIEHLRKEEHLEAGMLLVTDGRAEILESTFRRIRGAGVQVHTVMVAPERHPSLEALSSSFTALDISPDQAPTSATLLNTVSPQVAPRPAYRI